MARGPGCAGLVVQCTAWDSDGGVSRLSAYSSRAGRDVSKVDERDGVLTV